MALSSITTISRQRNKQFVIRWHLSKPLGGVGVSHVDILGKNIQDRGKARVETKRCGFDWHI